MTKTRASTDKKEGEFLSDFPLKNQGKSCSLCQVRLRPESAPVTYAAKDLHLRKGEWVLIPTGHGPEVGQVMKNPVSLLLPEKHIPPYIIRLATTREIEDYYKNLEREQLGSRVCQKLINSLGLKMKLVRVERFFDASKIIFFYSADGRVDFRELVKELVKELRMRVEMRQIGIRHEAKLIGGIGCCGRELCCASFLSGFDPISIKMAKAQNLPLNPNKISGFCGRLLCCLTYEYKTYREMSQNFPGLGKTCETPKGQGKIVRHNIFRQAVVVAMPDGSFVEYTLKELDGTAPRQKEPARRKQQQNRHQKSEKTDGHGEKGRKPSVKRTQKKDRSQSDRSLSKEEALKGSNAARGNGKDNKNRKGQKTKKGKKKTGKRRTRNKKVSSRKNPNKKGDTQKS